MEATVKNSSSDGEWTVVIPSKGRQGRRRKPKPKGQEEEEQPWKSDDLEVDPQRLARLKQKMEISMKKIENSKFYTAFLEQLKSPEVSDQFRLVLGKETQLQMVMYGIGSIESYESPRFQLSIAILMKREFDWVSDNIEVFDPVLSATESSFLKSLGCTVLSVNEQARREALKPTFFFMPHCEANLYSNLLEANWRMDRLSRIALFGNSFQMYEEQVSFDTEVICATKRIIAAQRITSEFAIETVSDDYFAAFHDSSWHFFSSALDSELPLLVSEEF